MRRPRDAYNPSMTVRLGMAGHAMLGFGVPATFGLLVAPLTRGGFAVVIEWLVIALIVAVSVAVATPIALIKRPRWGRRWASGASMVLLTGWALTLALALGYPLGLLHPGADRLGSLAPLGWTGLAFLVVLALPAWWVLRLLRDPAVTVTP